MRVLILLFGCLLNMSALAAVITVLPLEPNQPAIVMVQGELVYADAEQFRQKTAYLTQAIVVFDSPGGNLLAGVDIGTTIRMRNFKTWTPDQAICASACGLAWLGGGTRYISPNGRIGFHAANKNGAETGTGNALVGAYLSKLGLSDRAIIYVTMASPESMTWLSLDDAKNVGLIVEPVPSNRPTTGSPPRAPTDQRLGTRDNSDPPSISFSRESGVKISAAELSESRRIAVNISKRIREAGTAGLIESIDACYARLLQKKTEENLRYCFILDAITAQIYLKKGEPVKNFAETIFRRHSSGLSILGLTYSKSRIDNWLAIARHVEHILNEISTADAR